jgi:hypothetical protein
MAPMDHESEARPLPIQGDSDDEWLEELLGAHRAAGPSQPTEPVAGVGCRAELLAEAEGEWLVELLGAHRTAVSSQPAQLVAWARQPGQSVALHPGQVTFLLLKHHCVTISPPMERIMVQPSALLVAASAAAV